MKTFFVLTLLATTASAYTFDDFMKSIADIPGQGNTITGSIRYDIPPDFRKAEYIDAMTQMGIAVGFSALDFAISGIAPFVGRAIGALITVNGFRYET
jgi:hypothetical protein